MFKKILDKLFGWYDPLMDWKWNVSNVWGTITHPFTRTWDWIIKSIQYSIILWKDFDWDYSYILILLQYKIRRSRKRIIKNNLIVRAPMVAQEMLHVEKLIDKFLNRDFCEEEMKLHDEKWGELEIGSEPEKNNPSLHRMLFSRSKAVTEEQKDQEEAEYRKILSKQSKEEQDCWNEIWDTIKKYAQGWWD